MHLSAVCVSVTVPLWWSPGSRHNPGLFVAVIIAILYSWLHGNVQDVEVFLSVQVFQLIFKLRGSVKVHYALLSFFPCVMKSEWN